MKLPLKAVVFLALVQLTNAAGRLPLEFVENCGQWPDSARFVAGKGPLTAVLEPQAVAVRIRGSEAASIRLCFEGARPDCELVGEAIRPAYYNFFIGSDQERWQTGVRSYASVIYRALYDGVDLRVGERHGRLEYDVLVAPNADLGQVKVRCEGVSALAVAEDGALEMQTSYQCDRRHRARE